MCGPLEEIKKIGVTCVGSLGKKIKKILRHLINKDIKKDNVLEELIDCINENIDEADKKIPIFK